MFYRETLARLLRLEKFRNLIETNIISGVALYTGHKPGLFENSLSNKGQLSDWRIAETSDLQSLVQTHYRQGAKMLLANPLSRLCSPSSGFFDPTLPSKLQALLKHLPHSLKEHENIRVYAYKDTAALARHVQHSSGVIPKIQLVRDVCLLPQLKTPFTLAYYTQIAASRKCMI